MDYFRVSPFKWSGKPNIIALNTKKNQTISQEKFQSICDKGIVEDIHFQIINLLIEYKYLTMNTLKTLQAAINCIPQTVVNFKDDAINNALQVLIQNGIMLQYYIDWDNDENSINKRTPNYYTLSKGGLAYIVKSRNLKVDIDKYMQEPPIIDILKQLSLGQMIANYKLKVSSLKKITINKNIQPIKENPPIRIHGILDFITNSSLGSETYKKQFIIEVVRSEEGWEKALSEKIIALNKFLLFNKVAKREKDIATKPIIILLCESIPHAKEVYNVIDNQVKDYNVFFTKDTWQPIQNVTETLIKIIEKDDNLTFQEYNMNFLKTYKI